MKTAEQIIKVLKERYIDAHCNPDFKGDKMEYIFQPLPEQTEKEIFYDCPNCGYRLTKTEFFSVADNYDCPNCKRTTLSQFKRVIPEQESKSAEEWLNKNYHEFFIHWQNTGRLNSFLFKLLEEYAQSHQVSQVTDIDIIEEAGNQAKRLTTNSLYRSGFYDGYQLGAKAHRDGKIPTSDKGEKGAPFDDPENFNPACDKCGHQNSENCNSCAVLTNE